MKNRQRLEEWAVKLTRDELIPLVLELVELAIAGEDVSFHDDALVPYCSHTDDPLIPGQKTYAD